MQCVIADTEITQLFSYAFFLILATKLMFPKVIMTPENPRGNRVTPVTHGTEVGFYTIPVYQVDQGILIISDANTHVFKCKRCHVWEAALCRKPCFVSSVV